MTNASTVLEGHAPLPVQMYNNGHEYDFISRAFINSTSLLIYDIGNSVEEPEPGAWPI